MQNAIVGQPSMMKRAVVVGSGLIGIVVLFLLGSFLVSGTHSVVTNSGTDYSGASLAGSNNIAGGLSAGLSMRAVGNAVPQAMTKSVAVGEMMAAPVTAPVDATVSTDRKVMRTGALSVRVQSADATVDRVKGIAQGRDGFVTDISLYEGARGSKSGSLTVSVPVDRFDEVITEIKKTASAVMNETVTGNDVTEAYIDLSARLKNKYAEEQAYSDLLGKAQKMSDIIEITTALSTVRGDIESMEGQKRYYDSRTTMAMITVSLTEDVTAVAPVDAGFRPWQAVKDATHTLLVFFEDLLLGLIRFVIVLIPALIIFGFIVFLIVLVLFKVARRLWQKYFMER